METLNKIRDRMRHEQARVYELSKSEYPGLELQFIINNMSALMKLEKLEMEKLGINETPGIFLMPAGWDEK